MSAPAQIPHSAEARVEARVVSARGLWLLRALVLPAVVAAANLPSLAASGYLLQVDSAYGPIRPLPAPSFNAPIELVQVVLQHIAGGAVTGRLFVGLALFLCGFAPMLLLRSRPWAVQCAAGLLGMLNPWVYDRLVDGQWGAMVSAALLFVWLSAWWHLRQKPTWHSAVALGCISALIVAFSDTFFPILVALAMGAVIADRIWKHPAQRKWTAVAAALAAILLLYGVVPFVLGIGPRSATLLQHVGAADWRTFASTTSPRYGLLVNLLGLRGYWAEPLGRFPTAGDGVAWWPLSAALLIALAIIGAWRLPDRRWLLAVGVFGILVSAVTALPLGLDVAIWLSGRLPIFGALREPQKFLSLWLLALVVLGAEAITILDSRGHSLRAQTLAAAMGLATLIPAGIAQIAEAPVTLAPVSYPAAWYSGAAYLQSRLHDDEQVLVLPWHTYEAFPFTGYRLVHNPAFVFFTGRLVTSTDLELPGEPPPSGEFADIAEASQTNANNGCKLARAIGRAHISWVIVEDAPDGERNIDALVTCGFKRVYGSATELSVLRGPKV